MVRLQPPHLDPLPLRVCAALSPPGFLALGFSTPFLAPGVTAYMLPLPAAHAEAALLAERAGRGCPGLGPPGGLTGSWRADQIGHPWVAHNKHSDRSSLAWWSYMASCCRDHVAKAASGSLHLLLQQW